MTIRPILFGAPMVRAILNGTKTQTRRIVKMPIHDRNFGCELAGNEIGQLEAHQLCPYGKPRDRLWVRETIEAMVPKGGRDVANSYARYRADTNGIAFGKWTPSIFMPRWASRITLEITGVRVERLQSISGDDCFAEGIDPEGEAYSEGEHFQIGGSPISAERYAFNSLWRSINGDESWEANPFVWVISFAKAA